MYNRRIIAAEAAVEGTYAIVPFGHANDEPIETPSKSNSLSFATHMPVPVANASHAVACEQPELEKECTIKYPDIVPAMHSIVTLSNDMGKASGDAEAGLAQFGSSASKV